MYILFLGRLILKMQRLKFMDCAIFNRRSFRYYLRQSYKRGLVGKGIAGSHLWKLGRADPTHLGRAQERQMRHFPKLAGEKTFRILERL